MTRRTAGCAWAGLRNAVRKGSVRVMNRTVCLVLLGLSLSGCGFAENLVGGGADPVFDGQRFRGGAKVVERGDLAHFVSTVRPASRSVQGAILAAEYEAIRHCIHFYGTSDIAWEVGPDTPPSAFVIENDQLSLRGRCIDPAKG